MHKSHFRLLTGTSQIWGALAAGFGIAALFGWVAGLPRLSAFVEGKIPMAPSTALLFVLYGSAIFLHASIPENRHVRRAIKMDPSQIDQILANLVVNARDAIAGVGKITIETGMAEFNEDYCANHAGFIPGRYALLAVSDNGSGMDRETLLHIFEPFFTTKTSGKGTGLGLSTVYGIAKQNNGFVNVYSEPGQGTTFRIYLPPHDQIPAAAEEARVIMETPTGRETILLVEDDLSLLNLCREQLINLGYTVIYAEAPEKALGLAAEYAKTIHLLVTDVIMPEMSGRDLRQQISALRPEIKYLFMSGYTADVITHHGVLEEGIHFLQKPFSRRDLATKVREALDASL